MAATRVFARALEALFWADVGVIFLAGYKFLRDFEYQFYVTEKRLWQGKSLFGQFLRRLYRVCCTYVADFSSAWHFVIPEAPRAAVDTISIDHITTKRQVKNTIGKALDMRGTPKKEEDFTHLEASSNDRSYMPGW